MPDVTLTNLYDGVYAEAGDYQYFASPSNPTICPTAQALTFLNNSIRRHVRIAERGDLALKINSSQIDVVEADYSAQTITIDATGGTFLVSITQGGVTRTTSPLAYDISLADLLTALQGICLSGPDTGAYVPTTYSLAWSSSIRMNIPALTTTATALTGGAGTATVATTDSARGFQREYHLDQWLVDSGLDPDFRGNLFVWRTDVTYPAPIYWPAQGDYRMKESYASYLYNRWPSEVVYQYIGDGGSEVGQVDIGGWHYSEVMYQRGRQIGFHETPTQAMTLEAHYLPLVKLLTTGTDKIGATLGLSFLIDHKELIEVWAAIQMRQSRNLNTTGLQGRYAVLLADFMEAVEKNKPQVSMAVSRRWRA
jgi:hypothetical protein